MPSASRRLRGAATQNAVAEWFRGHGWPYAESTGSGRGGADITGLPGLACEVKARRDFEPVAWIRQAARGRGLAFVVWRPDGMGPETVGSWPAMLTVAELTALLITAGYGDDPALQLKRHLDQARESASAALRDIENGRG